MKKFFVLSGLLFLSLNANARELTCAFGSGSDKFIMSIVHESNLTKVLSATFSQATAHISLDELNQRAWIAVEDLQAGEPGHYMLDMTLPLSAVQSKKLNIRVSDIHSTQSYYLTCF